MSSHNKAIEILKDQIQKADNKERDYLGSAERYKKCEQEQLLSAQGFTESAERYANLAQAEKLKSQECNSTSNLLQRSLNVLKNTCVGRNCNSIRGIDHSEECKKDHEICYETREAK